MLHGFATHQGIALWMQSPRGRTVQVEIRLADKAVQSYEARLDPRLDGCATIDISGLDPGEAYRYVVRDAGDKAELATGTFRTQVLWQYRTDPPTVRIATGSCAYLNDFKFDRPGKPYGGGEEIFDSIAATSPDLMLWLGDNIYLREAEASSRDGINRRYRFYRQHPTLQKLMTATPHVAIWDDHDFGNNDSDASYSGRGWSMEMFHRYWPLPYSPPADGLYGMVTQGDVDIFMLDDRSYRDPDAWPEGADKVMYGAKQIAWLKRALTYSKAPFKLVAGGSQFFNGLSRANVESFAKFPAEERDLREWLAARRIPGVIFLSGDRHFSELMRIERPGQYPLHELTVSPFTSGTSRPDATELANPARVAGSLVEDRNFAILTVSGPRLKRELAVELFDQRGAKRFEWRTTAADLATGNKPA